MQATKQKSAARRSQRRLIQLMSHLAETADDIIEEFGEYRPEFLASLAKAHEDARKGRVREIKSLADLM